MAVTTEQFPQALQMSDGFAIEGYKQPKVVFNRLFKPMRHRYSDHVEVSELGGVDKLVEKAELQATAMTTPSPGFSKHKYFVTHALAMQFGENFIMDEKVGAYAAYVRRLNGAVLRTQEFRGAQVFNSCDVTTFHTTSDGKALAANDHQLTRDGPADFDTLSAFASPSAASIQAMLTQFDTRKNERGEPIDENPAKILYHPSQQFKMAELLLSEHSPEDDRRAVNPISRLTNMEMIKWKWLTNENAIFILGDQDEHGLYFVLRAPMRQQRMGDWTTGSVLVRVSVRDLFLTWHPRGFLANIP